MAGAAAFMAAVLRWRSSISAESALPQARGTAAAAVASAGRCRVLSQDHRAALHAGSRRHDAGLRRVRDVPHVADQPSVRAARHRRPTPGGRPTVTHELRDADQAGRHGDSGQQPAAAEAARSGRGRSGAYRRNVLEVARGSRISDAWSNGSAAFRRIATCRRQRRSSTSRSSARACRGSSRTRGKGTSGAAIATGPAQMGFAPVPAAAAPNGTSRRPSARSRSSSGWSFRAIPSRADSC